MSTVREVVGESPVEKQEGAEAKPLMQRVQEVNGWTDQELQDEIAYLKNHPNEASYRAEQECLCSFGCPICRGAGWVRKDFPFGHAEFGRMAPCPRRDPLSMFNFANTGLTEDEIRGLNWEKLLDSESKQKSQKAIEAIIEKGWGWCYLWGESGNAKTLALKCAVADFLRKGVHARCVRMAEILEDLREAYDVESGGQRLAREKLESWAAAPVLAIEEFDRFRENEFALEKVAALMDRRYQTAMSGQSITLMASNKSPEHYEGYLRSRLEDTRFFVVHLDDIDLRAGMDAEQPEFWWEKD